MRRPGFPAWLAVLGFTVGCRTVVHHPDAATHPGSGGVVAAGGAGGLGTGGSGAGAGGAGAGGAGAGGAGAGGAGAGGAGAGGAIDASVEVPGTDGPRAGAGGSGPPGVGGAAADGGVSVALTLRRRLAMSGQRACALASDGTAWCWGRSAGSIDLRQPSFTDSAWPVPVTQAGTGAIDIAALGAIDIGAIDDAIYVLKDEGSLYRLTGTSGGIVTGVGVPIVSLSSGGPGCGLGADGAIFCWSSLLVQVTNSVRVPGLDDAVDVASTGWQACALRRDGTLWCWGSGSGNVGDGGSTESPRMVPELGANVEAVFAGGAGVCARKRDGAVACWGYFFGSPGVVPSFQEVADLAGARRIAIGDAHACAIDASGSLACFGANDLGQLGDGTFVAHAKLAPVIGLGGTVAEVVAGTQVTCALLDSGGIRCFGSNDHGALGDGSALRLGAAAVSLGSPVVSYTAPKYGVGSAVLADGSVRAWGSILPSLIAGAPARATLPIALTTPATAPPASKALVSDSDACLLTRAGALSCVNAPVTAGAMVSLKVVRGLETGVVEYADGCAVRNDGSGWCGVPTSLTSFGVPVSDGVDVLRKVGGGYPAGCGLYRDGQIQCWGSPNEPPPADQFGGTALDLSGSSQQCAVRADGAVLCWTLGTSYSPTAVLVPLPVPCVGVSAGAAHTCAWSADGQIFCWGQNNYGQLGDGTTATRAAPVKATAAPGPVRSASVGSVQTCVQLAADGSLWCWGWNGSGELGDGTGGPRAMPTAVSIP